LPLSAVAAATVQTVSYVGYKLFYNSLGVRPEEVGYDYASLLPRSAFQLALLVTAALALLSGASIALALYAVMLKPVWDDLRGRGSPLTTVGVHAMTGGMICTFLALLITWSAGLGGDGFVALLCALCAVLLVAGHWHARVESRPETSVLSHAMAPRIYHGSRRLILLGLAVTVISVYGPTALGCLVWLLILFGVDRLVPVRPRPSHAQAPGGGSSKWMWRAMTLGTAGALAFGFLSALAAVIDLSDLEAKADEVRAGARLKYSLLDPLTLAEPRADPVLVRWIGPRPPAQFTSAGGRRLTYLGQSDGTAVFLDTASKPQVVYRLPVSAIALEGAAQSVLLQ
jgi:hypothetical protein